MSDVTIGDLQAIGDIADWLAEQSDGMPTAQAIELLEAALVVQDKLKQAIEMLRTQALNTIEQPILIGNVAYAKKPQIKKRPNQARIAGLVTMRSSSPDLNGEVPTAHDAAETAVRLMRALYVSPSTVPKTGGVEKLGLTMSDVCENERTGYELRRTVLDD